MTVTEPELKPGRVVGIAGPVIDVEFPPGHLPEINTELSMTIELEGGEVVVPSEVAQQIGDNRVRAIAMKPTDGLTRGAEVINTGHGMKMPVGDATLGHVWNVMGEPLDVDTIRDLELSANLVTLSACETALGHRVRGEGIVGLTHAFLAAGARRVIVTTRAVEDRAAAEFMHRFYKHYYDSREVSDALFAARGEMIEEQANDPYAWAGFILVGAFR